MARERNAVRLRRTEEAGLWDGLVEGAPGALGFHGWSWLDLQETVLDVVFERLVAYVGATPVGVVPLVRRSARAVRAMSVPFPFLGPLVPAEHLPATFQALRRWQVGAGLITGRMEFGPLICEQARGPVREAGLRVREDTTVMVDLSHGSPEELFASFSKERRRDIRRAVRDGASVRPARPGEIAELMPRVLAEAFEARGVDVPYPTHTGRLVEEWAADRADVGLITACVDDEPAGIQVVLGGHPTALAWVGASLRSFRGINVNALLYLRTLEWAIEQGCERLDLCGTVDEGVLRYKLAFGGVEMPWLVAESSLVPEGLRNAARRRSS